MSLNKNEAPGPLGRQPVGAGNGAGKLVQPQSITELPQMQAPRPALSQKHPGQEKSNFKVISELIKEISGQSNTISIPRLFIEFTGDLVIALFLSQCVYWSDKSTNKDLREQNGFYKSAKEWREETGLSYAQVCRATDHLRDLGVITTDLKRAQGAPTLHYFVNLETLANLILDFLENRESRKSDFRESPKSDFRETSKSCTATTQKTTTAGDAVVAAVADSSEQSALKALLLENGVNGTKLGEIMALATLPSLAVVQHWFDYAATQDFSNPTGYVIKRLIAGDAPPPIPCPQPTGLGIEQPAVINPHPPISEAETMWNRCVDALLPCRSLDYKHPERAKSEFAGSRGSSFEDGTLHVACTPERRWWLTERSPQFSNLIADVVSRELGEGVKVVFDLAG